MSQILNRIINIAKTNLKKESSNDLLDESFLEEILDDDADLIAEINALNNNVNTNDIKNLDLLTAYRVLDLPVTATATEVKIAFKEKLNVFHPDKHRNSNINEYNYNTNKTQEIIAAYKLIMNNL